MFICTGITPSIAVDTVKKPSMPNSTGKILYVGGSGEGNYTKIQAAIWAANDGDTVFVYKGTYNECLEIEKTINLIGQNKHTTIIDGKNIPNPTAVVYLRDCNKVLLTGFTIQNGVGYSTYQAGITTSRATNYNTITGNIIADNRDGLKIYGDYHLISENIIRGNKDDGIHLTDSFNNTIINNTFESGDGIYILCLFGNLYQSWGSHNIENNIADGKPIYYYNNENGIVVSNDASQVILANCNNCIVENLSVSNMDNGILIGGYSSNNHIRSNSITDSKYGIDIECCAYYNYIYNNIIINTDYGVDIDYTPYNNISNNIITNSVYGITLWDTESNTIYGNTIEDNTIGIYSTPHSIPVKGVSYLSFRHRENEIYRNTFTNNDVGIYQFYWGGDDIYENKIINNRIGIYMDSMYGWGGYNNVFNNSIMENQVGIDIIGGFGGGPTNNNIYRNNIINNRIGIRIWHALFDEGTNDNKIYQNNFIGNRWFHARDNCISHYDENYWDNWIGFKIKLPIFQRFPKILFSLFRLNFDRHPAKEPYDIEGVI